MYKLCMSTYKICTITLLKADIKLLQYCGVGMYYYLSNKRDFHKNILHLPTDEDVQSGLESFRHK